VLIVVCGILILLGAIIRPGRFRSGRFRKGHHHKGNWKENYTPGENENSDGKINYQFVFSGTEQVILDPVFKGGRIDVTFGGMELDLRRTSLAEGDTFLSINTTFGGVEITAPDNWDIEIQAKSTIGGVTDSRDKNTEKDRTRKLIIIATCTLGGIEIK
ncbi:MAG: cell wall-active antibiotics response protein, partial [Tannerella sp.]|nr:cell wall-active antibiotics response protein [Tannerella sp.]